MVRAKNIYHVYFNSPSGSDPGDLGDGYLLKCGIPLIDFSCTPDWRYSDYKFNWHHIKTSFYRERVLPELETVIKFGYKKDDFKLVPCFNYNGNVDVSYSAPLDEIKQFEVTMLRDGMRSIGDSRVLRLFDSLLCRSWLTVYHYLFVGVHDICRIKNINGTGNGRKLVVVGDSMSVPFAPILAWYYDEMVYIDARDYIKDKSKYRLSLSDWLDSTVFDDTIIQFFHDTDMDYGVKLKTDLYLS